MKLGGIKVKDEIIETRRGNNTEISTLNGSFYLPEATITSIATMTNDRDEAIELLVFLKERVDSYNDSVELISRDSLASEKKFKYSPMFVQKLCVALLCEGFNPDQIKNALSEMKDYEIFGTKSLTFIESDDDRVSYVLKRVKSNLEYTKNFCSEENSYNNVDEIVYQRG